MSVVVGSLLVAAATLLVTIVCGAAFFYDARRAGPGVRAKLPLLVPLAMCLMFGPLTALALTGAADGRTFLRETVPVIEAKYGIKIDKFPAGRLNIPGDWKIDGEERECAYENEALSCAGPLVELPAG